MFNEITRGAMIPRLARAGEAGMRWPTTLLSSPDCCVVLHG